MMPLGTLLMGSLGISELAIIALLVLILFGPEKLPELARTLGRAMAQFRRASAELRGTIDHEMRELERHVQEKADQNPPKQIGECEHAAADEALAHATTDAPLRACLIKRGMTGG